MEVSFVRQQLMKATERATREAQTRRQRTAEAERDYQAFLNDVATPVLRLLAMALKAQGLPFTLSTPGGSVRLSADSARDDYIEVQFDPSADPPEVVARVNRGRGSRTLSDEQPLKPGASPADITEEDVLTFMLKALEPWLAR